MKKSICIQSMIAFLFIVNLLLPIKGSAQSETIRVITQPTTVQVVLDSIPNTQLLIRNVIKGKGSQNDYTLMKTELLTQGLIVKENDFMMRFTVAGAGVIGTLLAKELAEKYKTPFSYTIMHYYPTSSPFWIVVDGRMGYNATQQYAINYDLLMPGQHFMIKRSLLSSNK